jgi:glucose/mannose-6-phosphate isomerase
MNPAILDDISAIKALDSQNMLASLELLPEQMKTVAAEALSVKIPANFSKARQIVICGMGGSTLASHVIKNVYFETLAVPLEIVNGYELPHYVGKDTLVLVSSYSGTTEEAVTALGEARKRQAKIMVLTSGGTLAEQAKKFRLPALVFSTTHNPCRSPRMGLGYSLVSQLLLLAKTGHIPFRATQNKGLLATVMAAAERWGVRSATSKNAAKQTALMTTGRSVWYVGAEHLVGNAHIGANQMNENAKRFAGFFAIPELNHHLMEGMVHPHTNPDNLLFVLLESGLYDKRVQKRFAVTQGILDKNRIKHTSLEYTVKKPLEQVVETLVFTSYVSYYAALIEGIDPTAIPFVDFFKEQLKK